MATAERDVLINVRVSEEERAKLHAIADAADEPAAQTIRRFIRQRYAAEFGEVAPGKVAKAAGGEAMKRGGSKPVPESRRSSATGGK